jgi:hypothetical protein
MLPILGSVPRFAKYDRGSIQPAESASRHSRPTYRNTWAALVWFRSSCHSRGLRFGLAVDQDFGFAERDLGDLPVVVAFVLVVCLQAVDELRRRFESTAGFVRVLELMLGQGEDAQIQGPGERVAVIS